jgi:hypothetical protein
MAASTTADWLLSCVCLAYVSVLWPLASSLQTPPVMVFPDKIFRPIWRKNSAIALVKHFRSQV